MNLLGFIVSLIVLTGYRVVNRFYRRFGGGRPKPLDLRTALF
jgi:hypothetical protein